ncbi:MAG: hypothetical protein AAB339_05415 [Elusimicrobiota bacterium]
MKKINEFHIKLAGSGALRWVMMALGAVLAAVLALTLETGRAEAQSTGFRYLGALVRVITPNSDGKNDVAILCTNNPKDSAVSGTIFDLSGKLVSAMTYLKGANPPSPSPQKSCESTFPPGGGITQVDALTWDGRSGGAAVPGGVYLYQIQAEDATTTGTVVVAR